MRVDEIIGGFQNRSLRQLVLPAVRNLRGESHVLMSIGREHKWIWAILITLVSIQSYLVRELLSALLLFTMFFVILRFLVGLSALMGHVLYCSVIWAESMASSFQSFVHHSLALPVRVPSLVSHPMNRGRKLHGD